MPLVKTWHKAGALHKHYRRYFIKHVDKICEGFNTNLTCCEIGRRNEFSTDFVITKLHCGYTQKEYEKFLDELSDDKYSDHYIIIDATLWFDNGSWSEYISMEGDEDWDVGGIWSNYNRPEIPSDLKRRPASRSRSSTKRKSSKRRRSSGKRKSSSRK